MVDSRVSKRKTGRQENGKEKGVRNEYPFTELLREEKVRKGSRSHKGQDAYGRLFLGIAQIRRWDNLSGARKLGSFGPLV